MKRQVALFAWILMVFVWNVWAEEDDKLAQLLIDSCLHEIAITSAVPPESCFPEPQEGHYQEIFIPERIIDWGSNGLLGRPWQFSNLRCNNFFYGLFTAITAAHRSITLSPHDLFHAHIGGYGHEEARHFFMVFHAKEYPADLERVKNYYQRPDKQFNSTDEDFADRNFLYLSSTAQGPKLYLVKNQGTCKKYFSLEEVNTLSEKKMLMALPHAHLLGDVNTFTGHELNSVKYKFYTGYEEYSGVFKEDLEGYYTGYSAIKRYVANFMIDYTRTKLGDNMLYFLTGL